MAKIAVIAPTLSQPVLMFLKSLQQQKHDLVIITENTSSVLPDLEVPFLTYFKTWSSWEAFQFFPALVKQQVDIIHFVFSSYNDLRSAQLILASLARTLPQKIIAATFYGPLKRHSSFFLKNFMRFLDLATFSTREQLLWAKRRDYLSDQLIVDILPPLIEFDSSSTPLPMDSDQNIARLINVLKPFLFLPGSWEALPYNLQHEMRAFIHHHSDLQFLFFGPRNLRQNIFPQMFFLSEIQESQWSYLIRGCQALVLAFHDLSILELQKYYFFSRKLKIPLVVREGQVEAFPGLVLPKTTGWILSQGLSSFNLILRDHPHLSLPRENFQLDDLENFTDSTMNELNRLYHKAYQNRWIQTQ